jgi:Mn2+/Fe2+ NRAMP family transporter
MDEVALQTRWSRVLRTLGPGVVMAGAAIGGSHLVQSTRAGAEYRFELVPAVAAALVLKYPFMEFAPRYTSSTGESFLRGYQRVGNWAIWTFLIVTVCTMFFVTSALVAVTAGLGQNLFGVALSVFSWRLIVIAVCLAILTGGGYRALDGVMKLLVVFLAAATLLAVALVVWKVPIVHHNTHVSPALFSVAGISVVVALMGWMPSVLDTSVWYSLWALERRDQTGYSPTLREARFDFNLGYLDTAVMAFAFVALGALLMFGTGSGFSAGGAKFGEQLVALYTHALGGWTSPIVSSAVFLTMFSTTLAVFDAYPRVIENASELMRPHAPEPGRRVHATYLVVLAAGVVVMFSVFQREMTAMVDLATTVSFLTTPVLAYISYRIILLPNVAEEHAPGGGMRALSWVGIVFWTGFALLFIGMKFFAA